MKLNMQNSPSANDAVKTKIAQWRKDLPLFAKDCLKVLNKSGELVPLVFNAAQLDFHEFLERQLAEVGYIRASVLKGRQQGISTYVAARYYHRASLFRGRKVYILSHESGSTRNLFNMVALFQKHNPIAPETGTDNTRNLTFPNLEGSYSVATAGNSEGGRGGNVNLMHGSEAAFWENADNHFAASLQSIALLPGTEIILESTSAGPTGKFYQVWQEGYRDSESLFRSIFISWTKSQEYQLTPPSSFSLSDEPPEDGAPSEKDIAALLNLTPAQAYWRRMKIKELGYARYCREYPDTISDAWGTTKRDMFIAPAAAIKARNRVTEPSGPLIIGVDPASSGGDRFALVRRAGNRVLSYETRNKVTHNEALDWLQEVLEREKPARMNIDSGNIGQNIIIGLRSRCPAHAQYVHSVAFGSPSQLKNGNKARVGPVNRRAEMWGRVKDWLEAEDSYADIPDCDDVFADLMSAVKDPKDNGDWLLVSKAKMRKSGQPSPDIGDALALTFAFKDTYIRPAASDTFIDFNHGTSRHLAQHAPSRYTSVKARLGRNGWMA